MFGGKKELFPIAHPVLAKENTGLKWDAWVSSILKITLILEMGQYKRKKILKSSENAAVLQNFWGKWNCSLKKIVHL